MDERRWHSVCIALVLVCSFLCASSAWGVYTQEFVKPQDFSYGIHDRVEVNASIGGLTLKRSIGIVPFLWVPSPSEGIVSKIDARSGIEIARYTIGPKGDTWAPCAVACDLDGNAYVACGGFDTTGKIVKIFANGSRDLNGDGAIRTCGDTDGNLKITPSEVLSWGEDDRVRLFAEVGNVDSTPATILFDPNGYMWVGLWGECSIVKLDPKTGNVLGTVMLSERPSTMIAGEQGSLWVLCRDNRMLCQVNTVTCTISASYNLGQCSPGGICMDKNGKIWIGDYLGGLIGYQTRSGVWSRHSTPGNAGYAGVTVDRNGDIWAACPEGNTVAHFSGEDGSLVDVVPAGKRPDSISCDEDGYIWALNYDSSTTTRINPEDDKAEFSVNTCNSPYSNNGFAAYVTYKGTSPVGYWNMVVDATNPGAGWGKLSWKESGPGQIKMYVRAADTLKEISAMDFVEVENGEEFDVLRGQYLELKATMTGDGHTSPVLQAMYLEGVNLAPDVQNATATVSRIYNTDREMEPVGITGITDPEGDPVTVTITKVTQDEPVAGLSEEDEGPDATGVGGQFVWLRGERFTGTSDEPANGRVYTVHFKATDILGASASGKVKVSVPPGILPTDVAVDDGQMYDSIADQDLLRKHEQVAQLTTK